MYYTILIVNEKEYKMFMIKSTLEIAERALKIASELLMKEADKNVDKLELTQELIATANGCRKLRADILELMVGLPKGSTASTLMDR